MDGFSKTIQYYKIKFLKNVISGKKTIDVDEYGIYCIGHKH